jgi:uncharacterized membrane protein YgdD (TMEM256/DUF423 family)
MSRFFFLMGCLSAFLGVSLGAFAAHLLKSKLPPDLFAIFEVGVRYQIYHAFALFVVSWAILQWPLGKFNLAGGLFIGGTVFFSGSLYLLSLTGLRWFGAITPIGGVMFLLGWFFLALAVTKTR